MRRKTNHHASSMPVRRRGPGSPATIAASLLLLLSACGGEPEQAGAQAEAPLPAVAVAPVVSEDVTPSREFVGRVAAVDRVDLRARVSGFLEERRFTEGQSVQKGDLLFVLERGPYTAFR